MKELEENGQHFHSCRLHGKLLYVKSHKGLRWSVFCEVTVLGKKGKVSKGRRSWIATVILMRIVFRKIIGQQRLLRECKATFWKIKNLSVRKHNNFKQILKQLRFWWHWLLFRSLDIYLISIFLLRLDQGCEMKDPRKLLVAISISVAFSRLPDLAVFAEERAIYFSNYFSVRYRDKMD